MTLELSLFFFAASAEDAPDDVYRLLLEAARFADRHDFTAVWTPERHFQRFGGPYPNPALTSAALAMVTSRIQLRAGSVVAPLSSALRIAEEWAVVDQLSHGRVALSFATGWHADDFVLAPAVYPDRRADMIEKLSQVRRLWRGETLTLPNGEGRPIEVGIQPRPIQPELDIWLTCQQDSSFSTAGELGYKVLTNLNDKTVADLERKCRLYRDATQRAHDRPGHFTLMTHTFIGRDDDHVDTVALTALARYLETRVDMDAKLYDGLELSDADRAFLARRSAQRFLGETSLIGSVETCAARARRFHAAGVDELACLIDFGVPFDEVMASLERLVAIKAQLT